MSGIFQKKVQPLISDDDFDKAIKEMDNKDIKKQELVTESKNIDKYDSILSELNKSCGDKDKVQCNRCKSLHYEIEQRENQLNIDIDNINKLKAEFDKLNSSCSLQCTSCNQIDDIENKKKKSEDKILEIRGFFNPWFHKPIEEGTGFNGGLKKSRKRRYKRTIRKRTIVRSKKRRQYLK